LNWERILVRTFVQKDYKIILMESRAWSREDLEWTAYSVGSYTEIWGYGVSSSGLEMFGEVEKFTI